MNDMTILCYLDVLGYSKFIRAHYADEIIVKYIEEIFQSSIKVLKDLREQEQFDDPALEDYFQSVFNTIRIRFISDSITFMVGISKVPTAKTDVVEGHPLTYCLHSFFRLISMFCTTLTGKTGLVVRGGMAVGPHYERDWDEEAGSGCLFVFSKALVDAVELEKKEAKTARIVVAEDLVRYLREKTSLNIGEFVFKDRGGKPCFDLYNILHPLYANHAQKVLGDIKKAVTMNMADSSSDSKALEKLQYFSEYHNKWVRKFCADTDLLIDCAEK